LALEVRISGTVVSRFLVGAPAFLISKGVSLKVFGPELDVYRRACSMGDQDIHIEIDRRTTFARSMKYEGSKGMRMRAV